METDLIGVSANIARVRELIQGIADTDLNTVVCGETGVGKELVVKMLYQNSERNGGPFIKVNCAALPDNLLESEMFGYERGAFTGAQRKMRGKFEQANRGVLFLDEIGDMSISLQAKLLHALQDGDIAIGQSMAILEYLEETYPDVKLLPDEQPLRSQVRAFCNMIACDIHPILNLRVMNYVRDKFDADPTEGWYTHWMHEGFAALEQFAGNGPFVLGDKVTLADAFMVPQMYNARRFEISLDDYPKLVAAVDHCNTIAAFQLAAPEAQLDATTN